jgi:hypothetical protein
MRIWRLKCSFCNARFWRWREHDHRVSGPYERGWHSEPCPGHAMQRGELSEWL